MTIEQKKISLINWITNLDNENIIDEMIDFQKASLSELPSSIVQLLKIADSESEENLIKHSNVRAILDMK